MSLLTTLDLETKNHPLWTNKYQAEYAERGMTFPPLPLHVPVVIAWLVVDTETLKHRMEIRSARKRNWESAAMKDLRKDLTQSDEIITYNGGGFDMPLLTIRAIKNKIDWSWWEAERAGRHARKHFDLQRHLTDFSGRGMRLDIVLRVLGQPGKRDIDGSMVHDLWTSRNSAKRDKVEYYCQWDVFQTWYLYLKLQAVLFENRRASKVAKASERWAKRNNVLGDWDSK